MFCTASLACLISSRFGRLCSLHLAGDWGIVLNEGLNGQEHRSVSGGRETKEDPGETKREIENKQNYLYLFCSKI